MLEKQFDQAPLSGPEMPVHTASRQAMKQGNRLLRKKSFEFVAIHGMP